MLVPPRLLLSLVLCCLCGCVSFPDAPPRAVSPALNEAEFISIDGYRLPLRSWQVEDPKAAFIALHGMNDHAGMWDAPSAYWNVQGITLYAYDQRGFGRTQTRGRWPGAPSLVADLSAVVDSVKSAHPETPVYVIGHSMGGAVVLTAMEEQPLAADGVILAAPAVWGASQMPIAYRVALNLAAGIFPGKKLTGERAQRQATDNIDVLRAMAADPLMIGETRLDATLGVVRLMGEAWRASETACGRILFLAGDKDEIIPPKSLAKAAARLNGDVDLRTYPDGWHLLLRDLQAENVWRDVADWVLAQPASDPAQLTCEETKLAKQ